MNRTETEFTPLSAEFFRKVVTKFNKDKAEYLEKHPELKEKFSKPKHLKAQKEKLSLREKVNSFGVDLTSRLGITLLIIFIIVQIIFLIELSNY